MVDAEGQEPGSQTRAEIQQEPDAIRATLAGIDARATARKILERNPKIIIITGSGTSSHAAMAAMFFLHVFAKVHCYSIHPSEIPYYITPVLDERSVLVAISQSGESSDTIEACTIAKEKGCLVIPIVNEKESTMARSFPDTVLSRAGKESSVLATKTYSSQLAVVASIALEYGLASNVLAELEYQAISKELHLIPDRIEVMRESVQESAKHIAKYLKFLEKAFVLGVGADVATALEGALKFKEGARVVAQGYSAPEFAHGPSTLADRENLIIMFVPAMHDGINDDREKIVYKIIEKVQKQGASVLVITPKGESMPVKVDFRIDIPKCPMVLNPLISIVPLQYLVLEIALQKGLNPDKPEWLTKVARI